MCNVCSEDLLITFHWVEMDGVSQKESDRFWQIELYIFLIKLTDIHGNETVKDENKYGIVFIRNSKEIVTLDWNSCYSWQYIFLKIIFIFPQIMVGKNNVSSDLKSRLQMRKLS